MCFRQSGLIVLLTDSCLRLTAAYVTNIKRNTPRGLFGQSRKIKSIMVTFFERPLKELHALEKSAGPFSVLAWCKYSFSSVSGIFFGATFNAISARRRKCEIFAEIKRIALNQSVLAVFYLISCKEINNIYFYYYELR